MGDAIHRWVHDTALQVAPRAARGGADGANRSSREMDINVAARKDIPKTETEIRIEKHTRTRATVAEPRSARGVRRRVGRVGRGVAYRSRITKRYKFKANQEATELGSDKWWSGHKNDCTHI